MDGNRARGTATKSPLVGMMEGRVEPRMPPKSELRPDEIAIVRAWIDAGAKDSPGAALTLDARLPRDRARESAAAGGEQPRVRSEDGGSSSCPGYREVRR